MCVTSVVKKDIFHQYLTKFATKARLQRVVNWFQIFVQNILMAAARDFEAKVQHKNRPHLALFTCCAV